MYSHQSQFHLRESDKENQSYFLNASQQSSNQLPNNPFQKKQFNRKSSTSRSRSKYNSVEQQPSTVIALAEPQYRHQTFTPYVHYPQELTSQIRHATDPEETKYQVAHISTEETKTDDPRELSANKNYHCSTHNDEQPIQNINQYKVKMNLFPAYPEPLLLFDDGVSSDINKQLEMSNRLFDRMIDAVNSARTLLNYKIRSNAEKQRMTSGQSLKIKKLTESEQETIFSQFSEYLSEINEKIVEKNDQGQEDSEDTIEEKLYKNQKNSIMHSSKVQETTTNIYRKQKHGGSSHQYYGQEENLNTTTEWQTLPNSSTKDQRIYSGAQSLNTTQRQEPHQQNQYSSKSRERVSNTYFRRSLNQMEAHNVNLPSSLSRSINSTNRQSRMDPKTRKQKGRVDGIANAEVTKKNSGSVYEMILSQQRNKLKKQR